MTGHTIKRCFELIGYPPNFNNKSVTGQSGTNNVSVNSKDVDTSVGTSHTLTSDQHERLMSLLSDTGSGSMAHANVAVSKCLWQNKLGHPADQVLEVLQGRNDLKGIHTSGPCEVCHRAKQTINPFPLSDHKTNSLLQRLLKGKDDIFQNIKLFYNLINNRSNEPYDDERDVRDGGGTYLSLAEPCSRLVAKGYSKKEDINYEETFSLMVKLLSQVMHAPKMSDMKVAFKVLRCIEHSPGKGIQYSKSKDFHVNAFVDFDWPSALQPSQSLDICN
ncbi:hypothetical protein Tco_1422041, partial [Tanacetum coccineum]